MQVSKLLKYSNNPWLKLNVLTRSNLLHYDSLDKISRLCDAGHDLVAHKLTPDHKSLARYMQSLHCKYDCDEMNLLFHFLFVKDAKSVFHGKYDMSKKIYILENENFKWNIENCYIQSRKIIWLPVNVVSTQRISTSGMRVP